MFYNAYCPNVSQYFSEDVNWLLQTAHYLLMAIRMRSLPQPRQHHGIVLFKSGGSVAPVQVQAEVHGLVVCFERKDAKLLFHYLSAFQAGDDEINCVGNRIVIDCIGHLALLTIQCKGWAALWRIVDDEPGIALRIELDIAYIAVIIVLPGADMLVLGRSR